MFEPPFDKGTVAAWVIGIVGSGAGLVVFAVTWQVII